MGGALSINLTKILEDQLKEMVSKGIRTGTVSYETKGELNEEKLEEIKQYIKESKYNPVSLLKNYSSVRDVTEAHIFIVRVSGGSANA